jgi:hypothetical protein
MDPVFPILVGLILMLGSAPLAPVREGILDPRPGLKRMNCEIRSHQDRLSQRGMQDR